MSQPATPRRKSWLTKPVPSIVVLVVVVGLVLTCLQHLGIVSESQVVAANFFLFLGLGSVAGVVAARHRKRGNYPAALTGYRIAVWCLFLACMQAMSYPGVKEKEEFFKRYNEKKERMRVK
jgi:hypothetical protein